MSKKIKLKTCKGAAKRFKLTGKNHVRFRRANRGHNKVKQSSAQVQTSRRHGVMCKSDEVLVHRMLNVR